MIFAYETSDEASHATLKAPNAIAGFVREVENGEQLNTGQARLQQVSLLGCEPRAAVRRIWIAHRDLHSTPRARFQITVPVSSGTSSPARTSPADRR
jgi:hypothetical protein